MPNYNAWRSAAIWDMRPAQRASWSRLRLAVAKSELRSDAQGEALCRRAEAVVGVAEIGGDAAARGATGELDVVPPRAASGRAPDAVRGASRVLGGRGGVVGRVVPIAAPFVNVLAHVKQAVTIRLALADGFGSVAPTVGLDGGQRVAPRIELLWRTAAGGKFPFGFGRQADGEIPLASEPVAVCHGIEPVHTDHGERGIGEFELAEGGVIRVGHLAARDAERGDGDAMGGAFVIAPVVLAHEKLAAGDCHQIAWARHA